MKKIIASAIAVALATTASAGTLVYTAPEVTMLEEPSHMGGSGAWLIPLIIIAVLALALTNDSNIQPNGGAAE